MKVKYLVAGISFAAMTFLVACEKDKKDKPSGEQKPTTGEPTTPSANGKVGADAVTLEQKCAQIQTDSDALTAGLKSLCLVSENGAKQAKVSMLIDFASDVRVVKGGDAENDGMTRDAASLLGVKSVSELKTLICSTHKDNGVSAEVRHDLFDLFYARYVSDDRTRDAWTGGIQTGEISASTVDATVCAGESSISVLKMIVL